jgi:hypothetical protein
MAVIRLKIKSIQLKDLTEDIVSSDLMIESCNVDNLVASYNSVLSKLLDRHAPVECHSVSQRELQPWINDDILSAKRRRRKQETLWRKNRTVEHRKLYKECCNVVKCLILESKSKFYINEVINCNKDQKKLYKIVNHLLGREKTSVLPDYEDPLALAGIFVDFFTSKIDNIRLLLTKMEATNDPLQCPAIDSLLTPSASLLSCFDQTTVSEITSIVKSCSSSSCMLDPIPTTLLRDLLPVLAPVLVNIVNASLKSGVFPTELKSAIVKPLIKKPSLDPNILKNFRPVSNLSFISKLIEKVVASRLIDHMQDNNLLVSFQSAYRKGHSTETALVRVHDDIVRAVDKGYGVCLVLLDLSAAFDTVDHTILLKFLHDHIGLRDTALNFFQSYLDGRTQNVSVEDKLSEKTELKYGVPQGSVLGPIEFCIYTIPLSAILNHYNIDYHIYADDTQIYCKFNLKSVDKEIELITNCISDIRSWMISNKLKINDDKTEFLVISSSRANVPKNLKISIGQEFIFPTQSCKSLGVIFDKFLTMEDQINSVSRGMLYHIRNLKAIRNLLPTEAIVQLMHSLVSSRLDYCNALLYNLPAYQLQKLQRIQNIAARVVTLTPIRMHITPVLKSLHWLPVTNRIVFKVLLLAFKCVNSLAPEYLCDLVKLSVKSYDSRSNANYLLEVPRTYLKTYGDRSFSFAAATEWNKIPLIIRQAETVDKFKQKVKTYLFDLCFK